VRTSNLRTLLFFGAAFWAPMLTTLSADAMFENPISFDFVNDREFPVGSDSREFAPSFTFSNSGVVLEISAADQLGMPVDVSRRGPGGLGVVGNGDRDQPGGGTTSGNRVNAGESLIVEALDRNDSPQRVRLVGITLSRIVRDLDNFPQAPETRLSLFVDDGPVVFEGILDPELDDQRIVFSDLGLSVEGDTFTLSNGTPFDLIANRYRISGITVGVVPEPSGFITLAIGCVFLQNRRARRILTGQ